MYFWSTVELLCKYIVTFHLKQGTKWKKKERKTMTSRWNCSLGEKWASKLLFDPWEVTHFFSPWGKGRRGWKESREIFLARVVRGEQNYNLNVSLQGTNLSKLGLKTLMIGLASVELKCAHVSNQLRVYVGHYDAPTFPPCLTLSST